MSSIEGSYSVHFAKGLVGWDHPDLPALNLAAAVLNAAESYLWKSIRGSGLAYGANMEVDAESGLTGFSVYRVRLKPDDRRGANGLLESKCYAGLRSSGEDTR